MLAGHENTPWGIRRMRWETTTQAAYRAREIAMIRVAPSILSADFARLGEQVRDCEAGGADRIHIDVMDGHFVPNLSMGPVVVQGLRPVTRLPLEVHLMVDDPGLLLDDFASKGADTLIVHHEVLADPRPLLRRLHRLGKKAGVAIKPDTPVAAMEPYLGEIDLALCMTVYPGFSGQSFLPQSPERIRKLRELINRRNPACELEVDGGIDHATAHVVVGAGATVLVAATAVFGDPRGPAEAVRALAASVEPT
jgi:ribulose-phosphate 3-epimerase